MTESSFAKIPKVLLLGFEVLPVSYRSPQTDPSLDSSEYPVGRKSLSDLLLFGDGLVVLSFTVMCLCLVSEPSLIVPTLQENLLQLSPVDMQANPILPPLLLPS
jgi:hypothetical protein